MSGQSGKFLDSLESFRTVWKVSAQSEKFPHGLESFQQREKFSDSLVNFRTVLKVSRQCQKFPYTCPMINMVCKQKQFMHFGHISVAKAIYTLLTHFCRKNDLRALSGKFLRVIFCRPESFDFLLTMEQFL